jgi:hypothetical protein
MDTIQGILMRLIKVRREIGDILRANIVVDMLTIMINRAKEDGQVSRLIPHLVDRGVSILQYADDTIIFLDHDLEKALNMKLILCIFE